MDEFNNNQGNAKPVYTNPEFSNQGFVNNGMDNNSMNNTDVNNTGFNNVGFNNTGFNNTSFSGQGNGFSDNNINNNNNSNYNQDFKPKKSHKGIIVFIIILLILAICAVVGFFLYKNDMLPFLSKSDNSVNDQDLIDTSEDEDCLMATDFSTLPKDNRYIENADSQDTYKILKPYGNVEGIINVKDEDIYKITINTENMMLFGGGLEYGAFFTLLDMNGNMHNALFNISGIDEDYDMQTFSTTEGKEQEYSYNNWKYFKMKGGCVCYYMFDRYENDNVMASFAVIGDNFKNMSEDDFSEFFKNVIDRITIENVGKYNPDDGVDYSNVLSNVDLKDIVISDGIKLDLLTNFNLQSYHVQGYFDDSATSITLNTLRIDSKDDKYAVMITETNTNTMDDLKDEITTNGRNWESGLINDEEVIIERWKDGTFCNLLIDRDGEIISISMMGLNNDERYVPYEDAINYLGEHLFK